MGAGGWRVLFGGLVIVAAVVDARNIEKSRKRRRRR
jgi:hypothetical protein